MNPQDMTQAQRQALWVAAGHSGTAPVGYGGESTSSADPAVAMQQEITNDYNTQNTDYQNALSSYEQQNPFNFDQALTQDYATAAQNLGPMFQQQVDDYMQGVSYLIGNTKQDAMRALTKLGADYDAYTGQAKNLLDTTMLGISKQYGNQGGALSGQNLRDQGVASANTNYDLAQAQREYQYQTQNTQIQESRELNQTIPLQTLEENQSIANTEAGDIYNQGQQLAQYGEQAANYNAQEYAVGQVPAVGQYGTAKTIPGMSSAQTQQYLQGLLPNVSISSYGGQNPQVATPAGAY